MTTCTPLPDSALRYAGRGGDQGLALTGLHLGDVAEVQRRAAHDLDVEVALAERALGGLADRGERLRQEVVEGLAVLEPLAELVGHAAQLGVGHRDEVVLDGVDLRGDRGQLAQDLALAGAQNPFQPPLVAPPLPERRPPPPRSLLGARIRALVRVRPAATAPPRRSGRPAPGPRRFPVS